MCRLPAQRPSLMNSAEWERSKNASLSHLSGAVLWGLSWVGMTGRRAGIYCTALYSRQFLWAPTVRVGNHSLEGSVWESTSNIYSTYNSYGLITHSSIIILHIISLNCLCRCVTKTSRYPKYTVCQCLRGFSLWYKTAGKQHTVIFRVGLLCLLSWTNQWTKMLSTSVCLHFLFHLTLLRWTTATGLTMWREQ